MNGHRRRTSIADPLLEGQFHCKNKRYMLRLHKDGNVCSWSPIDSNYGTKPETIVNLIDVITVRGIDNDHYYLCNEHHVRKKSRISEAWAASVIDASQVKPCYSFEIHYAAKRKSKFTHQRAIFCSTDAVMVAKWLAEFNKRIENFHNRPKSLLVILNPYGGRKKASDIYEKLVEPLFIIAGIQTNLLITERPNHAYEYLVENGWQNADGIVCVGGDGTLSEILNGIVKRVTRDFGINLNDVDVEIPPINVRVGIVPAGSTDTVLYSLHGSSDIVNAVVHIVLGDTLNSDICSVHSENQYLCSFISLMSYGYLGDVIKNSMSLRWMGPVRYDCAGAIHFVCHRSYEGTVSFLKERNPESVQSVCLKNNCHCTLETDKLNSPSCDEKWELIRGKFFMVTAANISCSCGRSPNGIAPHCHFADGYLNLLLIRRVTFCEKMKLLLTLSNSNKRKLVNKLDFVEIYKTRRFKFETGYGSGVIPATNISSWNIDGELMCTTHLHVQCHRQVIKFFTRRRGAS